MGRISHLEDWTWADAAFEVEGSSLADVFETAARAVAEAMVDPATLPADVVREVAIEASALDLLLFDWLSALVSRKDIDREVFPWAEARLEGEGPCRLTARLTGGSLGAPGVASRADVKAVTLHRFTLEPEHHGWRARFVLDL